MNSNPFAILRTPSPSTASHSSSDSGRFNTLKQKKMSHKIRRDSHKQSGNLWAPAKGWLTHYRCSACREVMTRKIAAKCPQKIHACEHIVCAKCIVKSFLIELNPICPVKHCGKCVNPRVKTDKPSTSLPLFFTASTTYETDVEEVEDDLAAEYHLPRGLLEEEEPYTVFDQVHYCGDRTCEWDCGELWCGCIDVCRGRCGFKEDW